MRITPSQARSRAVQRIFVGVAGIFLGIALCAGDTNVVVMTLPRSPVTGAMVILAGLLWSIAAVMELVHLRRLRRRRRPA